MNQAKTKFVWKTAIKMVILDWLGLLNAERSSTRCSHCSIRFSILKHSIRHNFTTAIWYFSVAHMALNMHICRHRTVPDYDSWARQWQQHNNHRFTFIQVNMHLHRSTCISWHLQLITGGFCWCSFTACMHLLKATSTSGLGRGSWSSPQQCYQDCLPLRTLSFPYLGQ